MQNRKINSIFHSYVLCLLQSQLNKKCQKSKASKIRGIPKLDDANDAGGRNSRQCTLILTEGDSAKTLAVSGLSVVGKDQYGVFPLRGKLLNVRDASHKQVSCTSVMNDSGTMYGQLRKEEKEYLWLSVPKQVQMLVE